MIAAFLSVTNLGIVIGIAIGGFIPFRFIYILVAILSAARIVPLSRIKMAEVERTFYSKNDDKL